MLNPVLRKMYSCDGFQSGLPQSVGSQQRATMELASLLIIFLILLFLSRKTFRRKRGLPPGPPRIPFLGSLPFLDLSKGFLSWTLDTRVTAHPLAFVKLGTVEINVINDFKLAKELFDKEEFMGKAPDPLVLESRFWNNIPRGILFSEGSKWSAQRRFSLKTLKDFGFGRKSIEESIHFEVEEMIENFFTREDDILLGSEFNIPIINILWQMVANKRLSGTNEKDKQLIESVNTIFRTGIGANFPLPLYRILPECVRKRTRMGQRSDSIRNVRDHLIEEIKHHQDMHDPESPQDFIDVYLAEQEKVEELNILDLTGCIHDFFIAGTETSSTTLKWILLYLTLHQDVQDR